MHRLTAFVKEFFSEYDDTEVSGWLMGLFVSVVAVVGAVVVGINYF